MTLSELIIAIVHRDLAVTTALDSRCASQMLVDRKVQVPHPDNGVAGASPPVMASTQLVTTAMASRILVTVTTPRCVTLIYSSTRYRI
ncbi:hypothetical protein PF007_g32358 [Phytophthora fragariae]|uniref:Uncharacterized protein n=1 Tax=Phytophthora fragariae TaxID=53985 RepID=A0A6A3PP79_9STRA|nr:hypothetical protein PF007_g32358 [Phytophthora fragariae]